MTERHIDAFVSGLVRSRLLHQTIVDDVRRADENVRNVKLVLQISRQLTESATSRNCFPSFLKKHAK